MTAKEYQELASRTDSPMSFEDMVTNAALGISGEAGEVTDAIKKFIYQGHKIDREELIRELGDVMWYIGKMARALDTDIEYIMEQNIEKLKKRYPNGFEAHRSLNRVV